MSCAERDLVLAVFLDGETESGDAEQLSRHLRSCDECQETLHRARHLDAALAQNSGVTLDKATVDRLLAPARLAAESAPHATAPTGMHIRPMHLVVAATLLLAIGISLGRLLLPNDEPSQPPEVGVSNNDRQPGTPQQDVTNRTELENDLRDDNIFPLPDSGSRRRPRKPRRMLGELAKPRIPRHLVWNDLLRRDSEQLRRQVLPTVAAAGVLRLGRWHGPWSLPRDSQLLAGQLRRQAGRQLLASQRPAPWQALMAFLAADPRDPVLVDLLSQARRSQGFRRFLRNELQRQPEGDSLVVIARLADPRLDRALRAACRNQPERCRRVAQAMRGVAERPRRVPLLLDLWQALKGRGLVGDPMTIAAWFQGLPAATTMELIRHARRTSQAFRRHRCILALGARRDARAMRYLLGVVNGPRHGDALAAGHALSKLQAVDHVAGHQVADEIYAHARRSRRPYVLLAALAGMRAKSVRRILLAMRLTPAEHKFLAAGRFNLEQFRLAAQMFRERGRSVFRSQTERPS